MKLSQHWALIPLLALQAMALDGVVVSWPDVVRQDQGIYVNLGSSNEQSLAGRFFVFHNMLYDPNGQVVAGGSSTSWQRLGGPSILHHTMDIESVALLLEPKVCTEAVKNITSSESPTGMFYVEVGTKMPGNYTSEITIGFLYGKNDYQYEGDQVCIEAPYSTSTLKAVHNITVLPLDTTSSYQDSGYEGFYTTASLISTPTGEPFLPSTAEARMTITLVGTFASVLGVILLSSLV